MKGRCQQCDKEYKRLDRHLSMKHGKAKETSTPLDETKREEEMEEMEELPEEKMEERAEDDDDDEPEENYGSLTLGSYPHYFYIGEKNLDLEPPPTFKHSVHMDEQCLKLAHFLGENDVRHWLEQNSNPFTLLALARCIHMLSAPNLVLPAHLKFSKDRVHREMKNKPNRRKRFYNFFDELDELINQFRPLFLKNHDLIAKLLKNYSIVYK